ncbi:hypothetical protein I9Y64_000559, partial [Citrobacter freundii]
SALIKPLPRLVYSHASFPDKIKSLASTTTHLNIIPHRGCVDGDPAFHIWRGDYRNKCIVG